ncbi:hypothetical protein [Proteus mirabilis]|uniref:hypothetical protein n=1 Tax=Proteus mirabilis TaxID=584 RepID=UPI0036CD71CC
MSSSTKSYADRTLIIGGGVLFAGVYVATVLAALNISDTQEKQLSQLDKRLQAVEMKMAAPAAHDGMNEQLDTLRQELTTLKQNAESQSKILSTVTARLAVTEKTDEQIAVLSDRLQKQQEQLETRQEQWAQALHQLREQRQKLEKTVNTRTVTAKPTGPENSRTGTTVTTSRSRSVPFQLTAIEQRGGRLLAALAPAGIRQLGQIQLLPVGGRYQSWEITDIQTDSVKLRYQGRTVTLRLP